jgi:hypothetical protein
MRLTDEIAKFSMLFVEFEALSAVTVKSTVLRDITP